MTSIEDPLLLLRQSIAADTQCIPTTSEDATSAAAVDLSLANATYLRFAQTSVPLTTPTRFFSSDKPVDLRSIYFAWRTKDETIPAYGEKVAALNEELVAGAGGSIQSLAFVEKLDLITWLEGASEESEYIKPLASETNSASISAKVASGAAGGIAPVYSGLAGGQGRTTDPRLAEIYFGERKMGDRNTILRGSKPTNFLYVRQLAEKAYPNPKEADKKKGGPYVATNPSSTTLVHNPKAATRRPDPIILLSPSASSLLRMSNIKSFLHLGTYVPAESSSLTGSASADILHIQRNLPSIDATRSIRFIIVDTPEKFKPEYWSRVVAVFTTGQAWQFKNYKWQSPAELFRNTLGVYVGWRGDAMPDTVKGWGSGVMATQVDKWSAGAGAASRWRDREVVENIWKGIEDNMRSKGWKRDSGPMVQ